MIMCSPGLQTVRIPAGYSFPFPRIVRAWYMVVGEAFTFFPGYVASPFSPLAQAANAAFPQRRSL